LQPGSITRRVAALAAALLTGGAAAPAFTDAPEYLRLFAPRAHRDTYRTAVSPLPLDAVLASLAEDDALVRDGGAWRPRHELPQDAFGRSGDYNLWTLNRLYGAVQPRVARGPRLQEGRLAESWILVSPYPDPSMTRLEPGTLRIIVSIP
jgi:hypothetical protein